MCDICEAPERAGSRRPRGAPGWCPPARLAVSAKPSASRATQCHQSAQRRACSQGVHGRLVTRATSPKQRQLKRTGEWTRPATPSTRDGERPAWHRARAHRRCRRRTGHPPSWKRRRSAPWTPADCSSRGVAPRSSTDLRSVLHTGGFSCAMDCVLRYRRMTLKGPTVRAQKAGPDSSNFASLLRRRMSREPADPTATKRRKLQCLPALVCTTK